MREYGNMLELQRHLKRMSIKIKAELSKLDDYKNFFQVARTIILAGRKLDFTKRSDNNKVSLLNKSKLAKHFTTLQFMKEKQEELDHMLYNLQNNFKTGGLPTERAVKETTKLKGLVQKGVDESLKVLQKMASKNAPPKFRSTVQKIADVLEDRFKTKDVEITYNMGPIGKSLQIVGYIHLKHLIGEDKFVYKDFYVMIVANTDSNGFFAVCSKDYKLPGTLKGEPVEGTKALLKEVYQQMSIESNVDTLEPRRPPIDTEHFQQIRLPYVRAVAIKDNRLIFSLKGKFKQDKAIEEIMGAIMKLVRKAHPRTRHRLKYKWKGIDKNRATLEFIFTMGEKPDGKLSSGDLNQLQEKFGLNQQQLVQIQRIVNDGD